MTQRPDPRILLRLLGLLSPYRWRLLLAGVAYLPPGEVPPVPYVDFVLE